MGNWELRSPIDIATVMPGVKQKILSISSIGMYRGTFGSAGWIHYNSIVISADGSEIFKHVNLPHVKDKWTDPPTFVEVNKSVEGKTSLGFILHQHVMVGLFSAFVGIHDNKIIMDCEYYDENPPVRVPVTVNVFDQDTGKLLKNTRVTIKSGARVVADGYTDSNGSVTFQNIDVGGYTLRVTFSGYNMLEQAIQVAAPGVEYDVYLVPIPAEPLDWWVIPAAVTGLGIGGLVLLKGRPKMPQIMVMR